MFVSVRLVPGVLPNEGTMVASGYMGFKILIHIQECATVLGWFGPLAVS